MTDTYDPQTDGPPSDPLGDLLAGLTTSISGGLGDWCAPITRRRGYRPSTLRIDTRPARSAYL